MICIYILFFLIDFTYSLVLVLTKRHCIKTVAQKCICPDTVASIHLLRHSFLTTAKLERIFPATVARHSSSTGATLYLSCFSVARSCAATDKSHVMD